MAEKKAKAEKKLEKMPPVTQFKIPARHSWGESPLELASGLGAAKEVKKKDTSHNLEGVIIGDFIAVRNEECDETFIIHKDVLAELAEAFN